MKQRIPRKKKKKQKKLIKKYTESIIRGVTLYLDAYHAGILLKACLLEDIKPDSSEIIIQPEQNRRKCN